MNRRASAGFTLLEVMVATLIVGSSLVAVIGLFGQITRTARMTEGYALATMLAESKLDELSLQSLSEGERTGTFANHPGFAWRLVVTPTDSPGVQLVVLTVDFSAPGGSREVILQTLQADRTLAGGERRTS